jgi:hypothetical protein
VNDIDNMSVDELRIAIAVSKGFTDIKSRWGNLTGKQLIVGPASDSFLVMPIKHWSSSIAAAYDLENEVTLEDRWDYIHFLIEICRGGEEWGTTDFYWILIHATAEQRCRAWLKMNEAKNEHST